MHEPDPNQIELLPCPFCGGAMQLRYALWPSEGDRDAVIHNVPGGTACPIEGAFSIDTFDNGVSVAEAWNRRHPPASREAGLNEDDWQALLSAVENLRGGGNRDEPNATDIRWRIASNLADIAERLRAALIPTKPEAKE